MSDEQRHETVEEFLKRGGEVTRLPDGPNSFYGVELDNVSTTCKTTMETIPQRVSWKDIEHDEAIIETDDTYWKKVDKKVSAVLKKYVDAA